MQSRLPDDQQDRRANGVRCVCATRHGQAGAGPGREGAERRWKGRARCQSVEGKVWVWEAASGSLRDYLSGSMEHDLDDGREWGCRFSWAPGEGLGNGRFSWAPGKGLAGCAVPPCPVRHPQLFFFHQFPGLVPVLSVASQLLRTCTTSPKRVLGRTLGSSLTSLTTPPADRKGGNRLFSQSPEK